MFPDTDFSENSQNLFKNAKICSFTGKLALMSHVRSMKHLQMEQIHQIQKRADGNIEQTEIGDIFQVVESNNTEADSEGKTQFYFLNGIIMPNLP